MVFLKDHINDRTVILITISRLKCPVVDFPDAFQTFCLNSFRLCQPTTDINILGHIPDRKCRRIIFVPDGHLTLIKIRSLTTAKRQGRCKTIHINALFHSHSQGFIDTILNLCQQCGLTDLHTDTLAAGSHIQYI